MRVKASVNKLPIWHTYRSVILARHSRGWYGSCKAWRVVMEPAPVYPTISLSIWIRNCLPPYQKVPFSLLSAISLFLPRYLSPRGLSDYCLLSPPLFIPLVVSTSFIPRSTFLCSSYQMALGLGLHRSHGLSATKDDRKGNILALVSF